MSDNIQPKKLTAKQRDELISLLRARFEENRLRHPGIEWNEVESRLKAQPTKLGSLALMEETGGEPDVVGLDVVTGEFLFHDCSAETPKGRVSLCYDRAGLESRKEHRPKDTAIDMAEAMGVELLTEAQYLAMQQLGEFDRKTSSWLKTPAEMRRLGGALYGERRYHRIFVGHNGAQSYYAVRGFRAYLKV